jgi:LPS O-antigen subunit length determinant protein (WzzB/FepE family)
VLSRERRHRLLLSVRKSDERVVEVVMYLYRQLRQIVVAVLVVAAVAAGIMFLSQPT